MTYTAQDADGRLKRAAFVARHPKTPRRPSHSMAADRNAVPPTIEGRTPSPPIDPMIVILLAGLGAEIVLPWAVIWLSDALVFDIPAWSRWLIFGAPAAVSLLFAVTYAAWRGLGQRPCFIGGWH